MGELAGPARPPTILLLAGEPSGDRHGAELARVLRERLGARCLGLAGPAMRAAGVEPVAAMEEISVLGVTEVFRHLRPILRARRRLHAALDVGADLVVPIDFPGFNLRIARRARERGVPVLYYVSPQIWAWGRGRLAGMARSVNHVAVVFPFEVPLYRAAGIPVTYVGHPLVEQLEEIGDGGALRRGAGLEPGAAYLALLPGSRWQEVERLLPPMLDAVRRLRAGRREPAAVIAAASEALAERARAEVARAGVDAAVVVGRSQAVAGHARAALVASGTATLETAALGTPLVIVYKLSWATWILARRLVRLPRIGLANIVAGESVAPELLQGEASGRRMAETVAPLLEEGPARARALAGLAGVRERLGPPGAAARVAEIAAGLLAAAGSPADLETAR